MVNRAVHGTVREGLPAEGSEEEGADARNTGRALHRATTCDRAVRQCVTLSSESR